MRSARVLRVEALEGRCLLSIAAGPLAMGEPAEYLPAEPRAAAQDGTDVRYLGPIDFWQETLSGLQGLTQDLRFTAAREGLVTVRLVLADPPAGTGLTLFSIDEAGARHDLATGSLRVDGSVAAGTDLGVEIVGARAGDRIEVANLVRREGTTAVVFGTEGADHFEFSWGAVLRATINGIPYEFDPAETDAAQFDGIAGDDSARLDGTSGGETVALYPGRGTMAGPGYRVTIAHTPSILAAGGGGSDVASLYDSAGNDAFAADPAGASMSGEGFLSRVEDVPEVHGYALAGGVDTARFFDSPADDVFTAKPTYAILSGPGYYRRAKLFELVRAWGSLGGNDLARLSGSPGDETLTATPTQAVFSGSGFSWRVNRFDTVCVNGMGGLDAASLVDSPRDDALSAGPREATFEGPGFRYQLTKFHQVAAHANSGGRDTARLQGSDGDDLLHGSPAKAILSGTGFYLSAKAFDLVEVEAGGGQDRAELVDTAGDDTLIASPTLTLLSSHHYELSLAAFDEVLARAASGGTDTAFLYDSAGDDAFVGQPGSCELSGEGYRLTAELFDAVHAYSKSGGRDTALLLDSPGDDTLTDTGLSVSMAGDGYYNRAVGFAGVRAQAGAGGEDRAVLYEPQPGGVLQADSEGLVWSDPALGVEHHFVGFPSIALPDRDAGEVSGSTARDLSGVALDFRQRPELNAADYYDPASPTLGIQDAIDALPAEGGAVYVPAGTYTLRSGLKLRSDMTLRGAGTETVLTRGPQVASALTAPAAPGDGSVQVENSEGFQPGDEVLLLAWGDSAEEPRTMVVASVSPGEVHFTMAIAGSLPLTPEQGVQLANLFSLVEARAEGAAAPVRRAVVRDLLLDGNLAAGPSPRRASAPAAVLLQHAWGCAVENTTVRGWVSSGIRVLRGSENRVENSTVEQTRFHGIVVEESSDTLVSGCTVRQSGYEVTASTGDGIVVFGGHDNRIEHSLVEQSHHHGIHVGDGEHDTLIVDNVSQYNGGDGLYFCWNVLRATVRGNDFHHNARHGIGSLGIGGDKGDRLNLVVGNVSRQNGVYGIEAVGGRANTIEDNVVLDNSQAAPGRYAGILLLDTLETTVRGNRSGGDAAPYAQRFGILETGRSDRNSITGNLCEGNGEAGVQIVGPLTFASGNVG